MRQLLSTLTRRKSRARRPAVRFESLEDRQAPAATSLYVITQDPPPGLIGAASTLKEYTPFGNLVPGSFDPDDGGPVSGVRGQARTFTLTAADPSSADRAAPFGYQTTPARWTTCTGTAARTGSSRPPPTGSATKWRTKR